MNFKSPRQRDPVHLNAIRQLPCIICKSTFTEAAHVRMSTPGKLNAGIGAKPHDRFTVPLCVTHHRQQHQRGERVFWESIGIDPIAVAEKLYKASPNLAVMERIALGV